MEKNNFLKMKIAFLIGIVLAFQPQLFSQKISNNDIAIKFNGNAKIEVGSPYIGIEFHHSMPVPQRISFYYPVANSFDLSTDYWKRDTSFISSLSMKINNSKEHIIGAEPFSLKLAPNFATFTKKYDAYKIKIAYNFSKNQPAAIITYELTNTSSRINTYTFSTKYFLTLRTCHTYDYADKIKTGFNSDKSTLFVEYENRGTGDARIFIANAGERIDKCDLLNEPTGIQVDNRKIENQSIKYLFKKNLAPNAKMTIVQIIGSTKPGDEHKTAEYMIHNYEKEINGYSNYVLNKSIRENEIKLNDAVMDHSVYWAKAILAANTHYIDGAFEPMPCPAEYNFFFTHDVLLTDLAVVNFDLQRVKNDLAFIISRADKNYVIPHAYYWKDSAFKTEYADADNWNNYWFIILSAKYLMHSSDTTFLNRVYPYLVKSLETGLKNKGKDDLIWSYRPDWWDIGKKFGPRAYMTILAIKALHSFNYISAMLNRNMGSLKSNEELADELDESLNKKLWADDVNYIMNFYEDGKRDEHFYMGSMLAAHYGLIDSARTEKLIKTVNEKLLDKNIGVYTVCPMNFNELLEFWNFAGNEAGDPYYYINGGVWPHANAWYALALSKLNRKQEAINFVRKTMTVKGIMNGPNGQPAMYEVRNGNPKDKNVYGTVDKPQFLWAAGWYFYDLYNIFLLSENDWNIQLNPFLPVKEKFASFDCTLNHSAIKIKITGGIGSYSTKYNGKYFPSFVIPINLTGVKQINLERTLACQPMLLSTSSILNGVEYRNNVLTINLKAFEGHKNITVIRSEGIPKSIIAGGKKLNHFNSVKNSSSYETTFEFVHKTNFSELITINF